MTKTSKLIGNMGVTELFENTQFVYPFQHIYNKCVKHLNAYCCLTNILTKNAQ